jgi:acyl carrier protein
MSNRNTIVETMQSVARDQNKRLASLNDNLVLLDSGLDSLCFAILVARLEDTLGIDPFTEAEEVQFPVTLGDFVRLYDKAA